MAELHDHMLTSLRDGTGLVYIDVLPPRDVENKQCVASLWEHFHDHHPEGDPTSRVAVTPEQARELLDAGAEWHAPSHLRAQLFPAT
jgi:hypothetical protein